jgi:hypothetical protein
MNNNLFYGLVILAFNYNCTNVNSQEGIANASLQDSLYLVPTHFSDDLLRVDELYTSIIRLDKQKNDEYLLSIEMQLKKNSYFVSPNAKGDFSGKFTIVLTEPNKIQTNDAITETPLSKEEYEKHNGMVNFVRENTTYKQALKVLSTENFETYGYLQFTIEPRCTLEKIPFILSFVDGKLSIKLDGC